MLPTSVGIEPELLVFSRTAQPTEPPAKLFANSGDPDQILHSAESDLGLHCLPITINWYSDYNGLTKTYHYFSYLFTKMYTIMALIIGTDRPLQTAVF